MTVTVPTCEQSPVIAGGPGPAYTTKQMLDRLQQKIQEFEKRRIDVDDLFRLQMISVTENSKSR